jgi:hypothetical protein
MPITPDRFPGEREIEESLLLDPNDAQPTTPGEVRYTLGSFLFNESGIVRGLGIDTTLHDGLNTLVHDPVINTSDFSYCSYGISSIDVWSDATRTTKLQRYDVAYVGAYIGAMTSSLYITGSLVEQIIDVPTYDNKRRITSIDRKRIV